jgi:signal transduction histidine kinase
MTVNANAESRSELAASRRRIVAASDQARRRIERDLHDGTQQRLIALSLAARAAEAGVPADRGDLRAELTRIAAGLADAVAELQEFSRGIHPAMISTRGLGPALRTLAVPRYRSISMSGRMRGSSRSSPRASDRPGSPVIPAGRVRDLDP